MMAKSQQRVMEIKRRDSEAIVKRRRAILEKTTLLEKGIQILDPEQFMWTQTKQNNDRHVEQMENRKDIAEEEDWAFKAKLVPLFLIDWKTLMLHVMLEFLNTFLIKAAIFYFGHKDKVYVINKQLIVNVFGVCVEGYVKDPKR
jgi:hypothetical protein